MATKKKTTKPKVDKINKTNISVYDEWKSTGKLKEKLALIEELCRKNFNKTRISDYLGISDRTLLRMRKDHPDVAKAMERGKETKITDLLDSMYKLAMGCEERKEDKEVNENSGKVSKKSHITITKKAPSFRAIVYLLTLAGGDKYKENYAELLLMKKRVDEKEEWGKIKNENNNDENIESEDV